MNYKEVEVQDFMGELKTHIVLDLGDGSFKSFPADESNPEYVAFLESLNDNTKTE